MQINELAVSTAAVCFGSRAVDTTIRVWARTWPVLGMEVTTGRREALSPALVDAVTCPGCWS